MKKRSSAFSIAAFLMLTTTLSQGSALAATGKIETGSTGSTTAVSTVSDGSYSILEKTPSDKAFNELMKLVEKHDLTYVESRTTLDDIMIFIKEDKLPNKFQDKLVKLQDKHGFSISIYQSLPDGEKGPRGFLLWPR
jgi:hypothetical protein